jgi:hypothetical protein
MTLLRSALVAALVLLVLSCGGGTETVTEPGPAVARLSVYVVNYPLAYFA